MKREISITKPLFKIVCLTVSFTILVLSPGTVYFYFAKENSLAESIFFSLVYIIVALASIVAIFYVITALEVICRKLKVNRDD